MHKSVVYIVGGDKYLRGCTARGVRVEVMWVFCVYVVLICVYVIVICVCISDACVWYYTKEPCICTKESYTLSEVTSIYAMRVHGAWLTCQNDARVLFVV